MELINFKQDDIIYSKSNASNNTLAYKNDNNDFIYKICVENKEGQLKGLDQNNSQININTGDCFFETSGINYKLGDNETKVNLTEVKLNISVFKNCPEDTNIYKYCNNSIPHIKEKDFIIQIKINRHLPESIEQTTISDESTEQTIKLIELFNKKKILYNINETEQQELINEIDFAIITHMIDSSLNNLMKGNFEDLIINFENVKYHITSSLNQNIREYSNISTIDLGECENILKNQNNITQSDTLIIFKVDVLDISSIPIVLYQIYHPITKERLNLTYCNNNAIDISYPVNINEKELFKYDPSSYFYSDICQTYTTEFQTDITLKDRQKEYVDKNLSLCEEDCIYNNYDIETKKVTCECYIKISFPIISEIKINKDK